ncbi:MAG: ABC transporter permease [Phycisphaerales bacterium]
MNGARIGQFLERYGVIIAFVVLLVWNGVFTENAANFRTPENLRNILNQNASTGIVAVGMTLVIVAGGIDLSVGSIMALAAAVALIVANALAAHGFGDATCLLAGLCAGVGTGLGCGFVNGLLVTLGRLPSFIATLGGLVGYRSITLALADAGEIRSENASTLGSIGTAGITVIPAGVFGRDYPLTVTWNIVVFLLVAIAGQVLLSRTRYGRHLVAVGGNETAARYSAIAVDRVRLGAFLIVGACSAIAGLMATARMASVSSSQLGSQMELDAIAAVVIGGTSMAGGRGRIWGTVLGLLILAIINNMLVMSDVSTHWHGAVKGLIIVLAVLIQRSRRG